MIIEKGEKFEVSYDDENEICRMKLIGNQNEKDAQDMFEAGYKLLDFLKNRFGDNAKIYMLNDLTRAGLVDKKAKLINISVLKKMPVAKVAILGVVGFRRSLVNFIYQLSGFKNAQFFDHEDDAIAWLKER